MMQEPSLSELKMENTELKKENAELKKLLSKVKNIDALLDEVMQDYLQIVGKSNHNSTVSDSDDVKKILKKYSRI